MKRLYRWLRGKWYDFKYKGRRAEEGYCMCGDLMSDHHWANHVPVDSWNYYRERYVQGEK